MLLFHLLSILLTINSGNKIHASLLSAEDKSAGQKVFTEEGQSDASRKPAEIKVIDVPELMEIINAPTNEIKVINFWATWCKPCVEELPLFEKVNQDPSFDHVEVLLVSLDFIQDLDTKVKKFIEKKSIQSNVMLLNNTDYNSWIDRVDPSWSGAIPATLIVKRDSGERRFYEKQFHEGELEEILLEF